jgi:uncharacterized phage protein (TIGR02220 family)
MAKGWISIHRKIQDCDIWTDAEPLDRRSAWIDLLLMANHEDKNILINGKPRVIKKGQRLTSTIKLAERWKWSVNRVRRYLALLERLDMVTTDRTTNGTILTIVNYGIYQGDGIANETTNETTDGIANGITDGITDGIQTIMKNNENNNIYNVELRSKIISYLNQKCGTNYKASTVNTKKHINARLNDGYKYEDFVKVIDNKYKDWKGTEWEQYLRPDTLFGTKFESYLNQRIVKEPVTKQHFENQNSYDFADLEKKLLGG